MAKLRGARFRRSPSTALGPTQCIGIMLPRSAIYQFQQFYRDETLHPTWGRVSLFRELAQQKEAQNRIKEHPAVPAAQPMTVSQAQPGRVPNYQGCPQLLRAWLSRIVPKWRIHSYGPEHQQAKRVQKAPPRQFYCASVSTTRPGTVNGAASAGISRRSASRKLSSASAMSPQRR